jgi:hypothetical protein
VTSLSHSCSDCGLRAEGVAGWSTLQLARRK